MADNTKQFLDKEGLGILVNKVKAEIKKVDDKAVKFQEFTYTNADGETATRKTIQLDNYDTISGIDTKGKGHNLIMLSKYDVCDMGARGVHANINGNAARPTYNDTKEIALVEDIEAKVAEIVDGAPEQFNTLKELSDALANNGDAVATINASLAEKANKADVDAALEEKQNKGNYLSYVDQNGRKVVTLNNNDIIGAVANTDPNQDFMFPAAKSWNSLICLNKYNVVDIGSPYTMANINTCL